MLKFVVWLYWWILVENILHAQIIVQCLVMKGFDHLFLCSFILSLHIHVENDIWFCCMCMNYRCLCYSTSHVFHVVSRVRFHYGHPDVFDRLFHLTRGGISKASKVINLSRDIFAGMTIFWNLSSPCSLTILLHCIYYLFFAGFNSALHEGNVTHHEYIQVGKGRGVGFNEISMFDAHVAMGIGEQTLSRDVYRLGHCFDFFRMLSCYFTTVGFYFSSLVRLVSTSFCHFSKNYVVFY